MSAARLVSSAQGNRRLLRLARHLRKVPRDRFRLSTWWRKDECGTVACAMGHACEIPEFKKLGLHLGKPEKGIGGAILRFPRFRRQASIQAAALFFGIRGEDAMELFYPYGDGSSLGPDATPAQVARHIERWVRRNAPAAERAA